MSWSGSCEATSNGVSRDSVNFYPPYDDADTHVKEQMDLGVEVADRIIASGFIGGDGKEFNVSMSGHANPNHEPAEGWANDMLSVSVSQK